MNITQVHATSVFPLSELHGFCGRVGADLGAVAEAGFAQQACDDHHNKQKGPAVSQAFKKFGCGGRI
ncbi:hypothetical protein [Bordetella genomosp. 4]|uniref:hypothetical protein n=1 Tax=Bordetella genomosp. 4 TaxID=463044 RepID=UPI0011401651|nr:hypothetical protein [Bordetella genomosp. 4]